MDQVSLHHSFDGYRDTRCSKVAPLDSGRPLNQQHSLDDICHSQGYLSSRSNTPSMTRGSSRSTSSSVVLCELCGQWGSQCGCQSQSDTDSVRFHSSDIDLTKSPTVSSVGWGLQKRTDRDCKRITFEILSTVRQFLGGPKE